MNYELFCKNIGLNIKFYRQHMGLTQAQLSEKMGMDIRYLSDIERGNKNITLKTLYKIAQTLQIGPVDLFIFPKEKSTS